MPEIPLRTVREAARCVERFRNNAQLCGQVCSQAIFGLYRTPLWRLLSTDHDGLLMPVGKRSLALTPELTQGLDDVKHLLERGIEDDAAFRFDDAAEMMIIAYRGMKLADLPAAQRQAWLEKIRLR